MKYLLTRFHKSGKDRVLIIEINENKFLKIIEMEKANSPISYYFTYITKADVGKEILGFYSSITNNLEEVEAQEAEILSKFNKIFSSYLLSSEQ